MRVQMIGGLEIYAPFVALGVLGLMFVAFILERYPPEVIGVCGVATLLAFGALEASDLLSVFSNSAPATIAAMFVLSTALVRTGVFDALTRALEPMAERHPAWVAVGVLATTFAMSAFVNNTPVVMVMVPVVIRLAGSIKAAPSRYLIPISYAAILGGTCTLIGTSTNLIVDGVVRDLGVRAFSLFEITPLGLAVGLVGGAFMLIVGGRTLPDRETTQGLLDGRPKKSFLVETLVPHDSSLIGKRAVDVDAFRGRDRRLMDVIRGDLSLRRALDEVVLKAGDRVILASPVAEVMSMRNSEVVRLIDTGVIEPVTSRASVVVEALLGPSARFLGKTLRHLRLRRRYGVYPLALHRGGAEIGVRLEQVPLEVGDTLLLEGAPEDLRRLADDAELINLTEPLERPFRRSKAFIALGVFFTVIVLATFDLLPIVGAAVVGVAAVLLLRCVDSDEAFTGVDWRILVLLFSMLAVGESLENTGAVSLIVEWTVPTVIDWPPIVVLALVYLLAMLLTELITNNAVAVVVTPIVVGLAAQLGIDPRPFIVAVMFAASASFATPIGYQTNTLVYAAGGYRFTDFLRIGIPMNLVVGIATIVLIPMFWSF